MGVMDCLLVKMGWYWDNNIVFGKGFVPGRHTGCRFMVAWAGVGLVTMYS